jgi:Ca2+-transporting ATPase
MITGDHKNTAIAIAKELGLKVHPDGVLTGDDIDSLNEIEFEKRISKVTVFARVTPKHKLRIVQILKKRKNIVAMTGDGVNDAPALKEANIGIAMGKCGTDVAKESSAMILLDDNFSTIVSAIREGRIIYDNIRKFIRYLLACNFSEILLMAVGALFGTALPLVPIQILWINLVTDGLPALALGVDPPDKNIMSRPPRKSNESIFSRGLGSQIFFSGLLIGLSCITAFITSMYLTNGDIEKSRTITFATMIIAELLYAFESGQNLQVSSKKVYLKTHT